MKKINRFGVSRLFIMSIAIFCFVLIKINATDTTSKIKNTVFVILCHIRDSKDDMLWRRCYLSIRQFYPNTPIVIIDDNSKIGFLDDIKLHNTIIIKSKYPGAGELLPYYYFLKYKWSDKMIFLHDSMYIKRPFTNSELSHPLKFHWHFDKHAFDDDNKIDMLLANLRNSNKLINYNHQKSLWHGCFGVACLIDLHILKKIEYKYSLITSLIDKIKSRDDRMALERIFALILFKEGYVNQASCSNFGCIFDYPQAFQDVDEKILKHLELTYPGAILKTWHGR
jgi:hypothetical protein